MTPQRRFNCVRMRLFEVKTRIWALGRQAEIWKAVYPLLVSVEMAFALISFAMMAARARHEMRLLIRLNSKDRKAVYRVEARQLFEGKEEVGRLVWLFDPQAGERLKRAKAEARAERAKNGRRKRRAP